jgi:hypothetical protein
VTPNSALAGSGDVAEDDDSVIECSDKVPETGLLNQQSEDEPHLTESEAQIYSNSPSIKK